MNKQSRLSEIDIAIGLTMILVVFGHNYFPEGQSIGWYAKTREFIYQFHMPLFMFLSGFLVYYSYKPLQNLQDYKRYVLKRVKKFIPPYLILSAVYIVFETYKNQLVFSQVLPLIHQSVFSPVHGPATFLWYLYVLFIFYLITPFIAVQNNRSASLILFFSFILLYIPLPSWFSMDAAGKHLFYFLGGGLIAKNYQVIQLRLKKTGPLAILSLLAFFIIELTGKFELPGPLIACTAILAIYYLSSLPAVKKIPFIPTIGYYTFQIYLLNSLIIGGIYMQFVHFGLFSHLPFWVFILVSSTLGILLPILLTKFYHFCLPNKRHGAL